MYPDHYTRSEKKVNIILAIEPEEARLPPYVNGSIENLRRWIHVLQINCNQFVFGGFIDDLLIDLEETPAPGYMDKNRYILWDNLSSHKTSYATSIIPERDSIKKSFWQTVSLKD